jgi:hypothetical protein
MLSGLFIVLLSVVNLSVIIQNVVFADCHVFVVMLNVFMQSVIAVSVVGPS